MEIGDIIKYPIFYRGFTITVIGMIATERKQMVRPSDSGVGFGYEVLSENNEIIWVWEHNIEEEVK